jgi:hypothetical protein
LASLLARSKIFLMNISKDSIAKMCKTCCFSMVKSIIFQLL